jgi:membrane-associated PAP2 superfamily phosphatase
VRVRYGIVAQADLLLIAFASVLLALASNRWSGTDRWIAALFFDPAAGAFTLRQNWLLSVVLHDSLKWLSVAVWGALLLGWIGLRIGGGRAALRRRAGFVLLASFAAVLAVNLLRAQSAHSCPWYLADFGGSAAFFRLFDPVPGNAGPGRCLPSGHAASAFMWLAVLPVLTGRRRVQACAGVLLLGGVAGLVQVVRGAHFLSHILLTAAACALVCGLAALAFRSAPPK